MVAVCICVWLVQGVGGVYVYGVRVGVKTNECEQCVLTFLLLVSRL